MRPFKLGANVQLKKRETKSEKEEAAVVRPPSSGHTARTPPRRVHSKAVIGRGKSPRRPDLLGTAAVDGGGQSERENRPRARVVNGTSQRIARAGSSPRSCRGNFCRETESLEHFCRRFSNPPRWRLETPLRRLGLSLSHGARTRPEGKRSFLARRR